MMHGVEEIVEIDLSDDEKNQLFNSAEAVKKTNETLNEMNIF